MLKASGLVSSINVLGPFWTIHQYDDLLGLLRDLGFEDGKTLFLFPYDWRLSNFETAKRLDEFVSSAPALREGNFDIVAHSMGGLVTRIWMTEHSGAGKVHKVIYLGTPFLGSMNSLDTISNGWGPFANLVAGGISTIRRVTLSFPSIYELFPAYADCCREGTKEKFSAFDILDADNWKSGWIPAEYLPGGSRRKVLVEGLANARRLSSIIANPPAVKEIKVTGDILDTKLWLYTTDRSASPDHWSFTSSRGDGTVPIWSAAASFKKLEGTDPSFVEHSTIFADKYVRSRIARELVPGVAPPVAAATLGEVMTSDGVRHLSKVRARIEPPVVAPGKHADVLIELAFVESTGIGAVSPVVEIAHDTVADRIAVSDATSAEDLENHLLRYRGVLTAPAKEDTFEVRLTIADQGTTSLYLTVADETSRK
ncbi:lipase/acyltransferase domain-containing protein [Bradyrhizobium ottawaense]|uniref:lipase/acyltransferase domain-containing protein n=1 Tax=Bradyrhizobium ottawaense TaxID=931866 RepID=UPI003FA0315E